MADRHVTSVVRDRRGRTVSLWAPGAGWSPIDADEAAFHIEQGLHHYWVTAEQRTAEIGIYHRKGRAWLRTHHDRAGANNLDLLPDPDLGQTLTGAFDVLVTVSGGALRRILAAMHAAGTIEQRASRVGDGALVEMVLGVPTVEPIGEGPEPGCVFAREATCWARDVAASGDAGACAVATTRIGVELHVADPDPGGVGFELRYTPLDTGGVLVRGAVDPAWRPRIDAALGGWLADHTTDAWRVPFGDAMADVALVRPVVSRDGSVQVGLGFLHSGTVEGFPDPTRAGDWSIAFSRMHIASRVYAALRDQYGLAPPPAGRSRVLLDADEQLYLDAIEVQLDFGAILISGHVTRDKTPKVTATFRVRFDVRLDAEGLLDVEVGDVSVELGEWYAQVLDFFSGNALTTALRDGLRGAVSGSSTGQLASMLSGSLLRAIAQAGRTWDVPLTPRPTAVHVSQLGLLLIGALDTEPRPAPDAVVVALPAQAGPTLLYGGGSATPGGDLRETRWDFGDGRQTTLPGDLCALVTAHPYPPGRYEATLTVVGDDGQEATAAVTVDVGG